MENTIRRLKADLPEIHAPFNLKEGNAMELADRIR